MSMKIRVNEMKAQEAQTASSVDYLTFDNVDDYKDVVFVLRGSNTKAHIIGKFKAYDGTELIALDNDHHMTVKAFRNTYHTEDEHNAFKSREYGRAILDAYIDQAKSLKFRVPAKNEYGFPNPAVHEDISNVSLVSPDGEGYSITTHCYASRVELSGYIFDSEPLRGQDVNLSKTKLLKLGSPEEAAKAIVREYALPDFPQPR